MRSNLPLGKYGEELAFKHLKSKGYKILQRNFRSRVGEIDIIVQDPSTGSTGASTELSRMSSPQADSVKSGTLVFVEVKTRFSNKYGPPEEAITPWKLKSIIRTAQFYKMLHPELSDSLRIDAVLIELSPTGAVKRLEHLLNISG